MIDVIGILYDGETPLPGWHINTTPEVMNQKPELEAFRVEPHPLLRVWAGDDPVNPVYTVPLRFTDEAEAQIAFGLS